MTRQGTAGEGVARLLPALEEARRLISLLAIDLTRQATAAPVRVEAPREAPPPAPTTPPAPQSERGLQPATAAAKAHLISELQRDFGSDGF